MNLTKYREQWLRSHRAYEKRAFRILRKMFRSLAKGIPFDQLTFANYSGVLEKSITDAPIKDAYLQIYLQIGLIHGRRVGASINKDIKDFTFEAFTEAFRRYLYVSVLETTSERRRMVREQFIDYVREIIGQGARDGKTIQEISRDITRRVNSPNFYNWQALRIARTETTTASNQAAVISAQSSNIVYEKVWISAHDKRVRRHPKSKFDHAAMDTEKVDENGYFNVDGELIAFPGAQLTKTGAMTSGQNVINCRCTISVVAKRDANGRIMRRGGVSRTPPLRTPPEPVQQPQRFVPAKNIIEAEKRIKGLLAIDDVSLAGLDNDEINAILKTLEKEHNLSPLKLTSFRTYKDLKDGQDAFYQYSKSGSFSYSDKSIRINTNANYFKSTYKPENIESYEDILLRLKDAYNENINAGFIKDAEIWKKKILEVESKILQGKPNIGWTISDSNKNRFDAIEDLLTHEIGHHRHHSMNWNSDFKFDINTSISQYGESNFKEYFAEWYNYFRKYGEKGIPLDILNILKSI